MYASRCAGPLHCVCAVGTSWSNFNGITENCRAYGAIREVRAPVWGVKFWYFISELLN